MPALGLQKLHGLGRKMEEAAPFHCVSLGGKCCADVSLANGTQYGISQGMQGNVCIGMAFELVGVRNFDAAECDVLALFKHMKINALAHAHIRAVRIDLARMFPVGHLMSWEVVSFGCFVAGDDLHLHASVFSNGCIIGESRCPSRAARRCASRICRS